ncbi:glycosyltransferase family 4 protein [soil metagenome]
MTGARILFVINSLAGGGAERIMMTLLAASHGEMARAPYGLALLDEEATVYPPPPWLAVDHLDTGGSLPRGLRRLWALVRRERPQLIVSFLTRSNILAVLVGRLHGCKVVISERVNTSAHLMGRKAMLARCLVRLTYPLADRVIAVSQGVADDLRQNFGVPAAKLVVVSNPVDVAVIAARAAESRIEPPEPPYFVAMGRLTKTKNPALALAAYAKADVTPRLVVLGDGPERADLERFIAEHGLEDRVKLVGFTANPFPLLAGAMAYISPSSSEGFPNALVEAMALGLPVIATNCASGPSEILADLPREAVSGTLETRYGFLVPTDDADALAAAMREMVADEVRRARWRVAGRERAQDFSVDRAVERYWRIFRDTIGTPSARRARSVAAHGKTEMV